MSDTQPPKKRAVGQLKSYGRQGDEKTIKSLSLDKELVKMAEAAAKEKGISFSQYVNELLAKNRKQPKGQ